MKFPAFALLVLVLLWQILALPLYRLVWIENALPGWPLSATPNFVLLTLLYFALEDRSKRALTAAVLCGFCVEFVSLDPWFSHTLGYLFAAWLLRLQLLEGWADFLLPRSALVLIGVAAAVTLRIVVVWLSHEVYDPGGLGTFGAVGGGLRRIPYQDYDPSGLSFFVFELAYNLVASWLVFPLLDTFRLRLIRTPRKKLAV